MGGGGWRGGETQFSHNRRIDAYTCVYVKPPSSSAPGPAFGAVAPALASQHQGQFPPLRAEKGCHSHLRLLGSSAWLSQGPQMGSLLPGKKAQAPLGSEEQASPEMPALWSPLEWKSHLEVAPLPRGGAEAR